MKKAFFFGFIFTAVISPVLFGFDRAETTEDTAVQSNVIYLDGPSAPSASNAPPKPCGKTTQPGLIPESPEMPGDPGASGVSGLSEIGRAHV